MRRFLALAAVAAFSTTTFTPALAQRLSKLSGETLGKMCTSPRGGGLCEAYIGGIADAGALAHLNDEAHKAADAPAGFCIPDGETAPAMRGHVVAWLRGHRDILNQPAGKAVFAALHDSYPCHGDGR